MKNISYLKNSFKFPIKTVLETLWSLKKEILSNDLDRGNSTRDTMSYRTKYLISQSNNELRKLI